MAPQDIQVFLPDGVSVVIYLVMEEADSIVDSPSFKSAWSTRELAEAEIAREKNDFLRGFLSVKEVVLDQS